MSLQVSSGTGENSVNETTSISSCIPHPNKCDCIRVQSSFRFIVPTAINSTAQAYILGTFMSEKIIAFLVEFITHVIHSGGYAGIAALMGIEFVRHSLPSELIMPFSGYLVYRGRFNLVLVTTAGAIGCNLGSAVAYWIGAKGGRPLVERYGRWVLMSHHDLDRMTGFFDKYGSITSCWEESSPWSEPLLLFPRESPGCRSCASTSTPSWVPGPGTSPCVCRHEAWRKMAHRPGLRRPSIASTWLSKLRFWLESRGFFVPHSARKGIEGRMNARLSQPPCKG